MICQVVNVAYAVIFQKTSVLVKSVNVVLIFMSDQVPKLRRNNGKNSEY